MEYLYESDSRDKRRMTTPPYLTEEQQIQILDLTREGTSIRSSCAKVGISYNTLARCIIRDPLFAAEWTRAREMAAHIVADSLLSVTDGCTTMAEAVLARVKSENIRTTAAWLNSQRYGIKQQVEVTHTVDLTKALEQANDRLKIADQLNQEAHERRQIRQVEPQHIERAIRRHDYMDAKVAGEEAALKYKNQPLDIAAEMLKSMQVSDSPSLTAHAEVSVTKSEEVFEAKESNETGLEP